MNKIFKVGLIGCGHIAETYFRGQQYFNNFKIIACADIDQKAADKCAKLYNIKSKTVSEILKDNEIEVILNLTIPQSHYSVSKKVLNSGKHVYSEKPLATYFAKGKELVSLAKKNGIGLVGISESNHFGMAANYLEIAAKNKCIAWVFTNASKALPPHGAMAPFFGTSPFAFGCPTKKINKPGFSCFSGSGGGFNGFFA